MAGAPTPPRPPGKERPRRRRPRQIGAHFVAATPNTGLTVQLCGDALLSNFCVFASPERSLVFD
ncbi:DUF2252 family protein, partial [Nocardia cyriacigeorgica]|uniref:DUF2252 family protein n=1 Tax=Nocardia cyriacigeorgica TaxID=135487 RepID=UPI003CC7E850